MKKLLLVVLISIFCGLALTSLTQGEPPHERSYMISPSVLHNAEQKKSTIDTVIEDTLNIILESGFAGAITLLLGFYIVRTDKLNRKEHADNFKRFTDLSTESNIQLSAINTRLENLEREAESQKSLSTMQMFQNKT